MRKYPSQRELMARTGPGRFSAGDGLYLQVTASGTRSWVFRYRAGDRQHWMGLGSARYLTLALAKQKAIDAQRLRLNGVDPLEAKRAVKRERRASQARAMTFRQAALAYIATQEPSWRGSRSRSTSFLVLALSPFPTSTLRASSPSWSPSGRVSRKALGASATELSWCWAMRRLTACGRAIIQPAGAASSKTSSPCARTIRSTSRQCRGGTFHPLWRASKLKQISGREHSG
jgi:Arm DNA-binding domain